VKGGRVAVIWWFSFRDLPSPSMKIDYFLDRFIFSRSKNGAKEERKYIAALPEIRGLPYLLVPALS